MWPPAGEPAAEDPCEVYFEFTAIGAWVKVVAIDAASGTEVSVVGPAGAAQSDLQRLALGKLKARLRREAKPHI
jgi:ABC-type Mn2+/Zn2+ transport system ATPase subunit